MDKVKKIIEELDGQIRSLEGCRSTEQAKAKLRVLNVMRDFVKDMVGEPSCDNLEQEIHNQVMELRTTPCYDELAAFARHFVNWQKEQMMKKATVAEYWDNWLILDPYLRGSLKDGDKVKIIILKEEL